MHTFALSVEKLSVSHPSESTRGQSVHTFALFVKESSASHRLLTKSMIRTQVSTGNYINSSTLWTPRFPKMYLGTLGHKGKNLPKKCRALLSFKSRVSSVQRGIADSKI